MSNMHQYIEKLPTEEMQRRHNLCLEFCQKLLPSASGLLIFSSLNIYYLTGTLGNGVLWLPLDAKPVLFLRHGLERARLESNLEHIEKLNSFTECKDVCAQMGSGFGANLAVEMGAVPWDMAEQLQKNLAEHNFLNGDLILAKARARKSLWELNKMRFSGQRHNKGLCELLPQRLKTGLSEYDIARLSWDVFFSLGHGGINRLGNFGEECFLGHIAVGDTGNYPSHFNGPLGLMGAHPATPYMGNSNIIWKKNQFLALDIGFILEGYHTDKTQVYFSGNVSNIPDVALRAHDACIEIQNRAAEALKVGAIPSEIWADALKRAEALNISDGFMGLGKNKVPFLGHGIGLVIDEYPVLAHRFDEPLEEHMTMAIEPKVGIAGLGMVGVENTYEVTPTGGKSISGEDFSIICVE